MKLKCSLCGTPYEFVYKKEETLPTHFPFCSNRCKAIDLGKWLNEEYRISTPLPDAEELTDIQRQVLDELKEKSEKSY